MNYKTWGLTDDCAKLILRLTVGILVLMHGIFKLQNPEAVDWISSLFSELGLPAFLAYLIYIGEVVAPVMLIVGYKTREAAQLVVVTLVVAIGLVHSSQIFSINEMTGGWAIELQGLYLFGALAIVGLGAGKYSVDAKKETPTV
ncbi:MAG: DoxX family protein [Candidatus Paceibacterota bacterium]